MNMSAQLLNSQISIDPEADFYFCTLEQLLQCLTMHHAVVKHLKGTATKQILRFYSYCSVGNGAVGINILKYYWLSILKYT